MTPTTRNFRRSNGGQAHIRPPINKCLFPECLAVGKTWSKASWSEMGICGGKRRKSGKMKLNEMYKLI